jgi:hypothetical protein
MQIDGYVAINLPSMEFSLSRFVYSGKTRTGRRIHTMTHVTRKEIDAFARPVLALLKQHMKRPAFQVAQIVSVPAHAPVQEVHRDHDLGRNKLWTMVVHRAGWPVNTLFHRSSHAEEHVILYRNRERDRMHTQRLAQMGPCPNTGAVLYDAYIMHTGAPNTTPKKSFDRLFVSFIDAALDADELDHLNEVSFKKASFRAYVGLCDCNRQQRII